MLSKTLKVVVSLVSAFVFVAMMFVLIQPKAVQSASCLEDVQVVGDKNQVGLQLDCPNTVAGYYYFNWGDGDDFYIWLDASGNTTKTYGHDFPYPNELNVFEAGIDLDGNAGLDYTFPITIDMRSKAEFYISDVMHEPSERWEWSTIITGTGSFTYSISNDSCDGLTLDYKSFEWNISAPANTVFAKAVADSFVVEELVPATLSVTDSLGQVVFTQTVFAPTCEVPKPVINVFTTAPYYTNGQIVFDVDVPDQGTSFEASTNYVFDINKLPVECTSGAAPVREVDCAWYVDSLHLRLIDSASDDQFFTIKAKAFFGDYGVESESEVVLPITQAAAPTCNLTATKLSNISYRFDYSWNSSVSEDHSLYFGDPNLAVPSISFDGLSGTGVYTTPYSFESGKVYTATLFVVGDPNGFNCEEQVVLGTELPSPTCTIEVQSVDFNTWKFRVQWANAYQEGMNIDVVHNLDFGDGSLYPITDINGLLEFGIVEHDYSWNTQTGRATYQPKLTIVAPFETYTCETEEDLVVIDPNWMPGLEQDKVFLPQAEKS